MVTSSGIIRFIIHILSCRVGKGCTYLLIVTSGGIVGFNIHILRCRGVGEGCIYLFVVTSGGIVGFIIHILRCRGVGEGSTHHTYKQKISDLKFGDGDGPNLCSEKKRKENNTK